MDLIRKVYIYEQLESVRMGPGLAACTETHMTNGTIISMLDDGVQRIEQMKNILILIKTKSANLIVDNICFQ